jgi:UDP-N-acetyl-D-galactosamine dehydrogenase
MGIYVANQVIKLMIKNGHKIEGSKVLVLGMTFKENCPDIRNSRVIDVIRELQEFGCDIEVDDPWADSDEVNREYGIELHQAKAQGYEAIIVAVAHNEFREYKIENFKKDERSIIYDLKGVLESSMSDGKL